MLDFQYFVIEDQAHKEKLALKAARMVPEEKVLVIYDRALLDDKAYITDDEFTDILTSFGKTEEQVLSGYDAVCIVTCAKGAEFAYNYGNAARYESVEVAREKDDKTLRAWSRHPAAHVIDNSVNFEDKINRGIAAIFSIIGQPAPAAEQAQVSHSHARHRRACAALQRRLGRDDADLSGRHESAGRAPRPPARNGASICISTPKSASTPTARAG